ncbi:hypothetical protein [Siminovitchia fordii]|uniref:Uncharacterized protein n=1 Tax=Siminovitchia fordii TaxID=254759 RepID=A0ABQ4KBK3_9BACI|nr:hypothetical protein [Siminovitchia fordii]GIN22518.1 hypothetical protein J1TS3_36520 [Siminovitchia fordii]
MATIVGVVHEDIRYASRTYYFKTDLNLSIGDLIVVDTARGYQLGEVVEVDANPRINVLKWVVDKVDKSRHKERLKKEAKLKEIKSKMDKRRKELEDIHLYQILAEKDDAMRDLLQEYLQLKAEEIDK